MNTKLATGGGGALAQGMTAERQDLMKRTIAKDATPDEFAIFMGQVNRTGLDPFSRQIHFIKYKDSKGGPGKMNILVGIDGYRLIADRTGCYAGNDDPTFEGLKERTATIKGQYGDKVETFTPPIRATVTVYKLVGGIRCPFTASALWSEYYPGDNFKGFMWRQRPTGQLGKCAESLALRKAFPQELSGLYGDTEFDRVQAKGFEVVGSGNTAGGPDGNKTAVKVEGETKIVADQGAAKPEATDPKARAEREKLKKTRESFPNTLKEKLGSKGAELKIREFNRIITAFDHDIGGIEMAVDFFQTTKDIGIMEYLGENNLGLVEGLLLFKEHGSGTGLSIWIDTQIKEKAVAQTKAVNREG